MEKTIPSSQNLRKKQELVFNEVISRIKAEVKDSDVYFIVDETCDVKQRKVVNLLVGRINENRYSPPMLIDVQFYESVDSKVIQKSILKCCKIIWPDAIAYEKLHLILTDRAKYMVKANEEIKLNQLFYPNVNHITCLAHALHNVCSLIQEHYKSTNSLISNMKKLLIKSNDRKRDFKAMTGLTKLRPVPIQTRWGTWLDTANYYITNFNKVKEFIRSYKPKSKSAAKAELDILFNEEFIEVEEELQELRKIIKKIEYLQV